MAANGSFGDFFVVWHGDDDTPPLTEDELEVFGCNVGDESCLIFLDGFETGNTSAWNSVSP